MNTTKTQPTFARNALAVSISLASAALHGADLPTDGNIAAGQGSISQSGDTLTVQQDSHKLIANWQSFDIGAGHTVDFLQPGSDAVALNRVLGHDASDIYGNLNANGKVFLINPNGVLFGDGASVNVGGLVASTLNIRDRDFLAGHYTFSGDGDNAAVINRGAINADGGAVALLGGQVRNDGTIQANLGSAALVAGNQVTLDFAGDGLLNVTVDEGTVDALVENKQLIRANGGRVLMTAKASDALLQTVVNNQGIIEAQTLEQQEGRIVLKGGFNGGTVKVAGTLDASAPLSLDGRGAGGEGEPADGGFIDTSGARVQVAEGTTVTTKADNGETGEWLIDPTDFHVIAGSAPQTTSGIGADALSNSLANTNVTLQTVAIGSDPGDIHVDAAVGWNAATTLTLEAHNDILINAPITVQHSGGGLALNYGGSGYHVNAPVSFTAGSGGSFSVNGAAYSLIHDVDQLQAMENDLVGRYALATDIDASATSGWNSGAGFDPVSDDSGAFFGEFDGLGHTIDALSIDRPTESFVGLFGNISGARLAHVGLTGVQVEGDNYVGALAGSANVSHVSDSFSVGDVHGLDSTGGLVGKLNSSRISDSYADATVTATGAATGGLVGALTGSNSEIHRSHAAGAVTGTSDTGGLLGEMDGFNHLIRESYATGTVTGTTAVGGLLGGMEDGRIELSYATGAVAGTGSLAGLVGVASGGSDSIDRSWASGPVGTGTFTAGLVGTGAFNATITNSYWDQDTTGQAAGCYGGSDCAGGATGLTTGQALSQSDYANLDFSNDWFMLDGETRPFLRSEYSTTIRNAHQLQLMAMDLSADYVLANDIDFSPSLRDSSRADMWATSGTAGNGFDPIGNDSNRFTGSLDGLGNVIRDLTINRPTQNDVGLFGVTAAGSSQTGIGLASAMIDGRSFTGALVGVNRGDVSQSYATGSVSGRLAVGGLVGYNYGAVSQSYATSGVTGSHENIGGLVGANQGSVNQSYATGSVTGASNVGGLVGYSEGSVDTSFWNTDESTIGIGLQLMGPPASTTNTEGKTLAELQQLATFEALWGSDIDAQGGTGAVWRLYEGETTPLLRTFLTALTVQPDYDGSGDHQTDIGAAADNVLNDPLVNGTQTGNTLTLTGSGNSGEYLASVNIDGLYSSQQGYDLIVGERIIADNNVDNAGDIALTNGVSWDNGTLYIDAPGGTITSGAINGGAGSVFDLVGGDWTQSAASLPAFTVNDFRLKEDSASFLRTLGGTGTTADPYQISDVYGLQGLESYALLSSDFALANDIDASGTVNWNAGAGFDPIGYWVASCASCFTFTGSLDGQGHVIDGLTINRPGQNRVGLFGYADSGSRLSGLGLVAVDITGGDGVGALAGDNRGSVSQSYAAGSVTGSSDVGGLVGNSEGSVSQSYATGSVEGNQYVGGLVGSNGSYGTVSQSYATGSVTGTNNIVGGLVGRNSNTGTVSQSYATGSVTGNDSVGGLVGYNLGAIDTSFWNTDATADGIGGNLGTFTNTTGKTLAELQQLATFVNWGSDIDAQGGTGAVWRLYEGETTPLLRAFLTALEVLPDYDGSGDHLTNIASIDTSAWNAADASHLYGTPGSGSVLTLTGSDNAGEYLASSNATDGLYSDQQGYDLITTRVISDANVANAGDIALTNGVSWDNGTLYINAPGGTITSGAIDGGAGSVFDLVGGDWAQSAASLPAFTVNDFRLKEDTASFLRVLGGDGSNTNPYQIGDIYGLQGLESYTLLDKHFVLANDIDASGTVNWYGGAGFDPIGHWVSGCASCFTGSLDGQGHVIDGLTINRPGQNRIGLFGYTDTGSSLTGLGLVSVDITGGDSVGALVGVNWGTISQSYATGSVTGNWYVGGLVGSNGSSVSQSYATGGVTGALRVGGLVGDNYGSVSQSYATGSVTGTNNVGGLVGLNWNVVEDSFWNTGTTADGIGLNDGTVTNTTGKTLAQLQQLATFTGAGWDIDAQGGTGAVWRLYEGHTTPLLRPFLTALTVNLDDTAVTYNGATQTGPGTWTASGPYDAGLILGTATGTGSGKDAGSYAIGIDGLYSSQQGYDLVVNDGSLIIDPAALTITANDAMKTYDAGAWNGGNGVIYSGFVGGEDETGLGGSLTYGGSAQGAVNAGNYGLTASGLTSGNYDISFIEGSLTIDKAPLTITANSDTLTYNGASQSVTGFTASGLVGGEDKSVLTGVSTGGGIGTNAGTYVHTASGTDGNYELTFADGALIIDKALATVTANSDTVTYNGGSQSVNGFTVTGLVGGEDDSVLTGINTSGGTGTDAGTYVHTASGTDGNYELTFADGALIIDKALATVTANSDTVTYNGGSQSVNGFTTAGLVGGEDENVLSGVTTTGGAGTNAGTYVHTASGTDGNYELTFVDGSLTIDKALATVTANSDTVTYNGGKQSVTGFTATGLVGGEDESVLTGVSTTDGAGTNAGNYVHTASGTDGNYELTFVDGALTIDKAALALGAISDSKTYDGSTVSTGVVTVSGLVGGDSLTNLSQSFDSKNAGTRVLTVNGDYVLDDGNGGNNYVITTAEANGTITPKDITGTITAADKVYDASVAAATDGTLNGVISGDALALITTGSFADKHADSNKVVNVSGNLGGADAGNYSLTTNATTTADIDRKVVTASVTADNKIYDGTVEAALHGVLNGTISGDDVELLLDGHFTSPSEGEKAVLLNAGLGGSDAGNYQLVAPASVLASILGVRASRAYQSAIASQPPEPRRLGLPADATFVLDIDDNALRLAMQAPVVSSEPAALSPETVAPEETLAALLPEADAVRFPLNSVRMEDEEAVRRLLTEMAAYLKRHPDSRVQLTGHADSSGTETYNEQLSEQRAQAVAALLESLGVAPDQIRVQGVGSARPLDAGSSTSVLARNRRVEFRVP